MDILKLYEDKECKIVNKGKWLYYIADQTKIGILEDEEINRYTQWSQKWNDDTTYLQYAIRKFKDIGWRFK